MNQIRIKQDGDKVLVYIDGKAVDMPWEAALELSTALRSVGKLAEEYAKADQIIHDHAIMTRAGVPFGLSNNPDIIEAVKTESCHNRELRRYMPSINSREVFGVPSIVQKPPEVSHV